jgi:hypothetical protein
MASQCSEQLSSIILSTNVIIQMFMHTEERTGWAVLLDAAEGYECAPVQNLHAIHLLICSSGSCMKPTLIEFGCDQEVIFTLFYICLVTASIPDVIYHQFIE